MREDYVDYDRNGRRPLQLETERNYYYEQARGQKYQNQYTGTGARPKQGKNYGGRSQKNQKSVEESQIDLILRYGDLEYI